MIKLIIILIAAAINTALAYTLWKDLKAEKDTDQ